VFPAAGSDAFCVYLPCTHHHPASPEADMLGRPLRDRDRQADCRELKEPSNREIADASLDMNFGSPYPSPLDG